MQCVDFNDCLENKNVIRFHTAIPSERNKRKCNTTIHVQVKVTILGYS